MTERAEHFPAAPSSVPRRDDPAAIGGVTDIAINGRRFLFTLFFVCLALELMVLFYDYHLHYRGVLADVPPLRRFFNMTREDSLAAWLGNTQTTLVAVTLWFLVWLKRHQGSSRATIWGWIVLAAFFSYMAIDDGTALHERIGNVIGDMRSEAAAEGRTTAAVVEWFPSYYWQLALLPAFAVLGLFTLLFLWRQLPDRLSRLIVFAALSLFVLAVAMDFVEGLARTHPLNIYGWLGESPALERFAQSRFEQTAFDSLLHFFKTVEEAIEMFANTLLWCVFLRHFMRTQELRLRFVRG